MLFPKLAFFLFIVLAPLSIVYANPYPKPSAAPKPKPKPPSGPSCKKEPLCCQSLTESNASSTSILLELLGIFLTEDQKSKDCGLSCIDYSIEDLEDKCHEKKACCDKSYTGRTPSPAVCAPFRADLARAGIAPRRWPDYAGAIRRSARVLEDGAFLLKATRGVADDKESAQTVTGMVWLTPPARIIAEEKSRTKTSKLDALLSLGSATVKKLLKNSTVDEPDGTNYVFLDLYLSEAKRAREEILKGRECFFINILFTHPSHRRRGVAAVLLEQCIKICDAAHLPILVEPSVAGIPIYLRFGFKEVYRSRIEYGTETFEWPVLIREPTE
ncbi:hypothetical protein EW145_g1860 [Phellinidium pouzarii]|uniref:N-acetyltransferase domain-containing protein n=1 Tax=Phellinidium pouzarii TaxID=167371 RepID=A0A4S4LEK8_9AGAM|nr:hypothetical protein EW145_g1860 [Phellinidium pouzarii]